MRLRLVGRESCPHLQVLSIALMEADSEFQVEGHADTAAGVATRLEVDGLVIHDLLAICEFVDEALDGPGLLPAEPLERALARDWFQRARFTLVPAVERLIGGDTGAAVVVDSFLDQVGIDLAGRDFLTGGGGAFGLADLGAAAALCRLDLLARAGRWTPRATAPVQAWMARVLAEPTVDFSTPPGLGAALGAGAATA